MSKKPKRLWNVAKALCWYWHPFEDRIHLRKKIIRSPRWEPESKDVQVWSETFHCWLDFDWNNVYRTYEILTPFDPNEKDPYEKTNRNSR